MASEVRIWAQEFCTRGPSGKTKFSDAIIKSKHKENCPLTGTKAKVKVVINNVYIRIKNK